VLELGSGEWTKDEGGVPVPVPGKSVGELRFARGVSLTVKKNGVEDVEVGVAEDAVDEVEEEEAPQVQATPRQSANFRASYGGSPGSAAIYSSPAYMRKAAKYSYLDGISRLFEDDWDNQDLPRKKARTSIGDVKSWKMVDRTPSPERPSSGAAVQEDQEMGEADAAKDTNGDLDDPPAVESATSPAPRVTTLSPKEQDPRTTAPAEAVGPQTSPLGLLAQPDVEDEDSVPATSLTSTLPTLHLPSASPMSQQNQTEIAEAPTIDPVTPRLVPLSSTRLPSTTPQISPLATKNAFGVQADADLLDGEHDISQVAEMPESHAEVEATAMESPNPTANDSLELSQPNATQDKSVAEAIAATTMAEPVTLQESESEDAPGSSDELAEEDAFSDDDEIMYEDDAEDVFDADGLEGEEPSDDETIKNPYMHQSPRDDESMEEAVAEEPSDDETIKNPYMHQSPRGDESMEEAMAEEPSDDETIKNPDMHRSPLEDQSMEDATSEEESNAEEQNPTQSQEQGDADAQATVSTPKREAYKQPGFASASTLLRGKDTRVMAADSSNAQPTMTTPFKKPSFSAGGVVPSTEFATPAARTAETPNKTPQSVRDKVMKRTFSSLFGIKGTPSPEKEDPIVFGKESNDEENSQVDRPVNDQGANEVDIASNQKTRYMGLDGQSESVETRPLEKAHSVTSPTAQASLQDDEDALEANDMPSVTARETSEQHGDAELPDASPRDQISAGSPPGKLINLDSDSDEDAKAEEIVAEEAPDSRKPSPPVLASTVNEHGDAEPSAASVQEDIIDIAVPEPFIVDSEEAGGEPDASEQQQSPNEEHEEKKISAPNDDDQDVNMLQTAQASEPANAEHDAVIPDSLNRPMISPQLALSPSVEVQDSHPFEPEQTSQALPDQSQPFGSVADVSDLVQELGQQVNGHETLLEVQDSVQPSLSPEEQESRSALAPPENITDTHDDSQSDLLEVEDVDTLNPQEQEPGPQRSSFASQVMQDNVYAQEQLSGTPLASFESQEMEESIDEQQQESGSPLAFFESQVAQDRIDAQQQEAQASFASFESQVQQSARQQEPDSPLASFESQVVQDSTSVQQQEPKVSLASFESQVVQDAQMSDVDEHSSRPVSRDTVEDFSPVKLGSFSQRISEVVSGTQAVEREDEPEVNDPAMLDQIRPEESGVTATSLSVDAMGSLTQQDVNTPSRVTTRSAIVELESSPGSPSSFGEFSPVKIGPSTNGQVLTPQATFAEDNEEDQEDDSMADETLIEQQLASELIEDPVGSDTRPLEDQQSAEGKAQYRPLDGTSEQDEQASRHYAESTKELPAYPTLPVSPSATQSQPLAAEPEARLSHASVDQTGKDQTGVEHTSITSTSQLLFDPDTAKASEESSNTPQTQQSEQERSDMPPPEQPKTPARKSLRSRLSNVPDVISAWFSPKRSSVAAQEAEIPTEVETPAEVTADTVSNGSARKKHAGGIATAHTYFTKLASLEKRLNSTGDQNGAIDVLAIVADSTEEPVRAKRGPRDYYTIFKIMDPSIPTSSPVRVEVFRPWKAVLPAADVGDVILLRGFVVKSRERQLYLLSTDSSAWCVWRFAEHIDNDGNLIVGEADNSVRSRRMSHIDVREEVKGPPVEYGFAEKDEARKLRDWWIETHDDSQGGASEEAVGNAHSEETDAIDS
jgi:hypothetical protein